MNIGIGVKTELDCLGVGNNGDSNLGWNMDSDLLSIVRKILNIDELE